MSLLTRQFGLSFPQTGDLKAAAEMLFEYDSGAAEDTDKLNQTYKVCISYSW